MILPFFNKIKDESSQADQKTHIVNIIANCWVPLEKSEGKVYAKGHIQQEP